MNDYSENNEEKIKEEEHKDGMRHFLVYAIIFVAILIIAAITATFAYFTANVDMTNSRPTNIVGTTECIDVQFEVESDADGIELPLNYPISDEYAMEYGHVKPVTVKVINKCTNEKQEPIDYTLAITTVGNNPTETDKGSITDNKIRFLFEKETKSTGELTQPENPDYLTSLDILDSMSTNYTLIKQSFLNEHRINLSDYSWSNIYKIDADSIATNSTNVYKIYLWIDYYEGDADAYTSGTHTSEGYDNSTKGQTFKSLISLVVNNNENATGNIDNYIWTKAITGGEQVIAKNPQGLVTTTDESDLVRRFVGTDVNNYICINNEKCEENDEYMYRIIGLTEDGKLKLIKATPYKESASIAWDTSYTTDRQWGVTTLNSELNAPSFLSNPSYIPEILKSKIILNNWKQGLVVNNEEEGAEEITASEIITGENSAVDTISRHIGLMYLSDYALATSSNETSCVSTTCDNWLKDTTNTLWTMTRYGKEKTNNRYSAWTIKTDGTVTHTNVDQTNVVYPVFYLQSNVTIRGGDGSITDPMIVIFQ